MTHARRGHTCAFCNQVSYGNGGQVSHGRAHVRRGEAVELVKEYGPPVGTSRVFLAPDSDRMGWYVEREFTVITHPPKKEID